ncbi:MAG TPA: FkbM family methyltransferase [Chlamydiae bacterium]|nr:FkbM family methyltransferase [Chlamydiota bacterium]
MKSLKIFIKKNLELLNFIPAISKNNNLKKLLDSNLFTLIDVGATGGMDGNWNEIKKICHYITFDPDPRAQIISSYAKHTNYNFALWSEKKENLPFYLTKYPEASTLFQLNKNTLSSFLNSESHEQIKISKINANSIENTLKSPFDFIKVDAEGADLEILKGAERFLKNSCLGIEVEVSFINRHKKAPYFSETDSYIRNLDFVLMDIQTEKWIRKNDVFSTKTNPQLIWGNAIYVLSKESLLKKFKNLSQEKREITFTKYIMILLIYHFHDYAIEICDYFSNEKKLISQNYMFDLRKLIMKSIPSKAFHLLKLLLSLLIPSILICIFCFSKKARTSLVNYLKKQLVDLSHCLVRLSRYGPNNGCISG